MLSMQIARLGEDVTQQAVYDAYHAYAHAAQEHGDVAGRKMIWPQTGVSLVGTLILFKQCLHHQLQIMVKIGQIFGIKRQILA